jgi:hypothetical protein
MRCRDIVAVGWLVLLFPLYAGRAGEEAAEPAPVPSGDPEAAGEEALWFPVGESIEYLIYWGKIPVARSTASTEWVEEDGRRLLAIRFRTKSNRVIGTIYPVDDFIESIIDPKTFLPVRFTKQLSEGRYRCDETTTFDHEAGKAILKNQLRGTTLEYEIDDETRDLVSFMYSLRTAEFPVGDTQTFRVMADEKLYDLEVTSRKTQRIKLPRYGKVESVMLEPAASFQGLFVRKGKMTLWVSEDERRLITRADIQVPVADVHLILQDVDGPGEDDWVADDKEKKTSSRSSRHGGRRGRSR